MGEPPGREAALSLPPALEEPFEARRPIGDASRGARWAEEVESEAESAAERSSGIRSDEVEELQAERGHNHGAPSRSR